MNSLHARLMLSLGLGWVLVVSVLLSTSWYVGRDITRESLLVQLDYQAEMLGQTIEQNIDNRLQALDQLGQEVQNQPQLADKLLSENSALLAYFDRLFYASAAGRIEALWPDNPKAHQLDISNREYFRRAREVHLGFVSEPLIGRISHTPLVVLVDPIRNDDGEFIGIVGGTLPISGNNFLGFLQRHRLGLQGFAGIASSSGQILVHPNHEMILQPFPGSNPYLELALLGWEGAVESSYLDVRALQAYQQIWSADWVIGVFLPIDEAYKAFDRLWWLLWIIGGAVILLTLPFIWWLLWFLLRPVKRFSLQIESITRGEQERIEAQSPLSELQSVARRFNTLLSNQARIKDELQQRQVYLSAVLDSSPAGIFLTDLEGRSIYVNTAYMRMTGLPEEALLGWRWLEQLHADHKSSLLQDWKLAMATKSNYEVEYRYWTWDKQLIWLEAHASPIVDEAGQVQGYIGTIRDITERKKKEEADRWAAHHDGLTHLLNRRGFDAVMHQAFRAWKEKRQPAVLLLIDLDHFKPINDNLGHDVGDRWLIRIAELIEERAGESGAAARQGGDEFALLLSGMSREEAAREAEILRQAVMNLTLPGSEGFQVTTSIGLASFEDTDQAAKDLVKRADEACYQAKSEGRNRIR
ncbi:diguanylate cyclase domain-containing protein [Marinospirillum perlucidum]|uniref:diguanylate cyclase domain-containing protein n=1 Tax=Marinospirillum perlucidum TaxID=1982602 RepID=UPI00138FA383|nr:diguanylate cyclase [Marinospirillum perlucidum]